MIDEDRILELLNDRKMTLVDMGAELGQTPRATNQTLRPLLEDMHRRNLLIIVGNAWTVAKRRGEKVYDPRPAADIQETHEITNGDEHDTPAPKRGNPNIRGLCTPENIAAGKLRRERIVDVLKVGAVQVKDIAAALEENAKTITNALRKLERDGVVRKVSLGTYALVLINDASNEAEEINTPAVPLDLVRGQTFTISARGGSDPAVVLKAMRDAKDAAIRDLPATAAEFARQRRALSVSPMCDLRAELMQTIDLVQDGRVTPDQVDAIVKLSHCVMDIDALAGAQ